MKNWLPLISLGFVVASFGLIGCSELGSFPDAGSNPVQTSVGGVSGNVFGGHAPLVGAHVYVVEPGTAGYGSVVKGLLSASDGATKNGDWTNSGYASDEFVPAADSQGNPFYGLQADATGSFTIPSSATCDVGSPVYIVGYGGSPKFPSGTNTFAISKVVVTGTANPYTFTFTVSAPPENAYVGEAVTIAGTIGATFTPTGTGVIAGTGATALSTSQFSLTSTTGTAGTYTPTGVTATFAPNFNPAAVNMALLGICPSNGTFATGPSAISYIYMNEISTVATAYALAGFTNTAATNQDLNDEFHIGSASTTQALNGITNATKTAANLYNIEGPYLSTVYAGEGHIANSTTAGGNGTVPQSTIDSLGNILAACVDSNNTYRITSTVGTSPNTTAGTLSTACQTLFLYASDNGVYDTTTYNTTLKTGHAAFNIAQAAISLARFPQGEGTGTTNAAGVQTVTPLSKTSASNFVSKIYDVPTGNVPFAPYLAAVPDSWVLPIVYTEAKMLTPYRNAIDSLGNVWVVGATASGTSQNYAIQFNNLGVVQYRLTGVDGGSSVAVDTDDNVWVTSQANSTVQEFSSTGTTLQASLAPTGINNPYAIAIDGQNNVWIGNESNTNVIKINSSGVLTANYAEPDANEVEGLAIDSTGAAWIPNVGNARVQKVAVADNAVTYNKTGGGLGASTRVAVDASDNAWFEGTTNNNLVKINNVGVIQSGNAGYTVAGGAGTNPEGLGIDGAGNVWVGFAGSGATNSTVAEFNNNGVYMNSLAFPGQNGTRGTQIDSSGNVWVVENATTPATLIELVGVAVPVVTPTALGVKNGTLGTKP